MTEARWERTKALFTEASEQPPGTRRAFVEHACAGDDALRREVLSLLDAAEGSDSLPGARAAIAATARAVVPLPHDRDDAPGHDDHGNQP